jgi:glycosyltransferase involved in cell wall biosynthesis
MARAVTGLLKDPPRRHAMGLAAKEWIKSNFNEEKMMGEIGNIYKELAKR